MKRNLLFGIIAMVLCVSLLVACTPTPKPAVDPIEFPEASEEYTKAKAYYGYYILQDSDVIFAMNEDESRFCVKFYAFAGQRAMILEGSVEDGICTVDPHLNGLFGEDVQMMYEDAMAEEAPWAPITRG